MFSTNTINFEGKEVHWGSMFSPDRPSISARILLLGSISNPIKEPTVAVALIYGVSTSRLVESLICVPLGKEAMGGPWLTSFS